MNKYMKPDPLQEIHDRRGGVVGDDLNSPRGNWTFNGEPAGDGLKICALVTTARHGERQYRDGVNRYRDIQRYIVEAPSDERIELGWEPFTQFQAVAQDEGHAGQLVTFTSNAWGGRIAVENLISDYVGNGRRRFPIVTLGSRPKKNDDKGNFDPTFSIIGWKAASDFADMLADMLPQPTAQPLALEPPERRGPEPDEGLEPGADPVDDLPF